MIQEVSGIDENAVLYADWIIDGMAAVRSVSPKTTWGKFADYFSQSRISPEKSKARTLVNVIYLYA